MRPSTIDWPAALVMLTIWTYWIIVGAMVIRRRRRTRKLTGVLPEQAAETAMWALWIPLVALWALLPWLALTRAGGRFALPPWATGDTIFALRAVAALVGVAALAGSIRAWREMGSHWTMAVTRDERGTLLTGGLFSRVRHPIYAFSIVLMLATLVAVPTWPMLVVAVVHVSLMALKARNEERFLLAAHGERYARYCRDTGRFVPRLTGPR
jgi:protein-S-isoprenylcysteine O-methyltransferase Ste14